MKDGRAIHGASDLVMKSNATVGEAMFEISGGKDKSNKMSFGFAKIVELTTDGGNITKVRNKNLLFKILIRCLYTSTFLRKSDMPEVFSITRQHLYTLVS